MSRVLRLVLLTACRGLVLALMFACWLLDAVVEPMVWVREGIGFVLQAAVTALASVDDALRRRIARTDR